MSEMETIVVIGAGLTGSMISLILAERGFTVELYEKRPDFREGEVSTTTSTIFGNVKEASKRSINLALSHRGQMALRRVGLYDQVMEFAIPMKCRAIHDAEKTILQPYGTSSQAINSVSRMELNRLLLCTVEKLDQVTVYFEHGLTAVTDTGLATFSTPDGPISKRARLVIGADGAFSQVRKCMTRLCRLNFSQYYIPHGYKELTIPASSTNEYMLSPVNALHIWPRDNFMLIALPNPDKTFTCTLFAPYEGKGGLSNLKTKQDVLNHFQHYFPDVVPLIPNLVEEYLTNPTGALATMKAEPWNIKDRILLIGDAAHAVVPFYGQGMNAGFEDCLILDEFLESYNNKLEDAVPEFAKLRRPQADALAELSFLNYLEMRKHTASLTFRFKKKVEALLHACFPQLWIPLYTMVSFTRIPYDKAIKQAQSQDACLRYLSQGLIVAGAVALSCILKGKWKG